MKTIKRARSKEDGIVFYSNTMPGLVAEAFVDAKNEIHTRIISEALLEIFSFFNEINAEKTKRFSTKKVVLLDILLVIALTLIFQNVWITSASLLFSLNSFEFIDIATSIYDFKFGSRKNTARFHSAEHMSINAYQQLQRIPTLEEVKKFSRFSPFCGSMLKIRRLVLILLGVVFILCGGFFKPFVYFGLILFIPLIVLFTEKIGLLKYLQIFFTSTPTDLELNVAIKGLEAYEHMEKEASNNVSNIHKHVVGSIIIF